MDIKLIQGKITDFIRKYKYVGLVLLVGLVFMIVPSGNNREAAQSVVVQEQKEQTQIEEKLEQILSQISGAGEVQVLLSVESGEETVYQTDNKLSVSQDNSNTQNDTVTVTDSQRNQTGLIKQTISPNYRGAVVVCEGADSAMVRLAIVEAVAKVTGLSSDRISVLKMK